jgi:hypothetical protein
MPFVINLPHILPVKTTIIFIILTFLKLGIGIWFIVLLERKYIQKRSINLGKPALKAFYLILLITIMEFAVAFL